MLYYYSLLENKSTETLVTYVYHNKVTQLLFLNIVPVGPPRYRHHTARALHDSWFSFFNISLSILYKNMFSFNVAIISFNSQLSCHCIGYRIFSTRCKNSDEQEKLRINITRRTLRYATDSSRCQYINNNFRKTIRRK